MTNMSKPKSVIIIFSEEEHEALKEVAKKNFRSVCSEAKVMILESISKQNGFTNIEEFRQEMKKKQ